IVLGIRELLSQAGFNCRDPEVTRKPVLPDFPRLGKIISTFSLGRQGKIRNFFSGVRNQSSGVIMKINPKSESNLEYRNKLEIQSRNPNELEIATSKKCSRVSIFEFAADFGFRLGFCLLIVTIMPKARPGEWGDWHQLDAWFWKVVLGKSIREKWQSAP